MINKLSFSSFIFVFSVSVLFSFSASAAVLDAHELEGAFVKAVKKAGPAVVNVSAEMNTSSYNQNPFGYLFGENSSQAAGGFGSGVIISADGLVITNHHVAGTADRITVKLPDGREFLAQRIGSDEKTDICLLRLRGEDFPHVKLADSSKVQVGSWAMALGNPFGLDNTVTLGIVSARGRHGIIGEGGYEDFVQTDAPINPGNSGGPLINLAGEVIGINTLIYSRSGGSVGVGFAVPSDLVRLVKNQLLKNGYVQRAYIGVALQDMTWHLAKAFGLKTKHGVILSEVLEGLPAYRAGLKRGDIIIALDGEVIKNGGELRNNVAHREVGSKVRLTILRKGEEKIVSVKLASKPGYRPPARPTTDDFDAPDEGGRIGIGVMPIDAAIAKRLRLREAHGLLVSRVYRGGLAAEAGIHPRDILLEAAHKPLNSVDDLAEVLEALKPKEPLLLFVKSPRGSRYVALKMN